MEQLKTLYQIAQKAHITVDAFPLPHSQSISLVGPNGECHIAIDFNQVTSPGDEAVKLAHELGHCQTGAFYNRFSPYDIRQKHENRANRWAYRQLLSPSMIQKAALQGIIEPWELAEHYALPESFIREALAYYQQLEEIHLDIL